MQLFIPPFIIMYYALLGKGAVFVFTFFLWTGVDDSDVEVQHGIDMMAPSYFAQV